MPDPILDSMQILDARMTAADDTRAAWQAPCPFCLRPIEVFCPGGNPKKFRPFFVKHSRADRPSSACLGSLAAVKDVASIDACRLPLPPPPAGGPDAH